MFNKCSDCGRKKAKSAGDVIVGCCPKWWDVNDKVAEKDCETFKEKERKAKIRDEFYFRKDPIGLKEYKEMRMNSYEREHILPLMTVEALKYHVDLTLQNITMISKPTKKRPAATYEETAVWVLLPELMKRIKNYETAINLLDYAEDIENATKISNIELAS